MQYLRRLAQGCGPNLEIATCDDPQGLGPGPNPNVSSHVGTITLRVRPRALGPTSSHKGESILRAWV